MIKKSVVHLPLSVTKTSFVILSNKWDSFKVLSLRILFLAFAQTCKNTRQIPECFYGTFYI